MELTGLEPGTPYRMRVITSLASGDVASEWAYFSTALVAEPAENPEHHGHHSAVSTALAADLGIATIDVSASVSLTLNLIDAEALEDRPCTPVQLPDLAIEAGMSDGMHAPDLSNIEEPGLETTDPVAADSDGERDVLANSLVQRRDAAFQRVGFQRANFQSGQRASRPA
jgi:hypothetical protein